MKRKVFTFLAFISLIGFAMLGIGRISGLALTAQAGTDPSFYLPLILNPAAPNSTVVVPPADEATTRITVPSGFAIRIFAKNLTDPRLMNVGPDGWVYAASPSTGQVVRLPDRNKDGLADGVEVVASGLIAPHNIEWNSGYMYVAETGQIDRFSNPNASGVYQTRELVTSNIPGGGGHSSRTLHFGPDGKLYVSGGSTCNYCVETDPRRAAILRFNPDGSIPADNPYVNDANPLKRVVWADGLRNSVDFLWTPDGKMWADMNSVDGLGDNLPPEPLLFQIQRGKWYGWPYCYTPKLGLNQPAQPEVADTRLTLPAGVNCAVNATPALLTTLAHSAPLGMTLANKTAFPSDYQDDIFIALHGSWNTSDPANYRDCRVERAVFQNGVVVGSQVFANGWRAPGKLCGDPTTWGRPAGLTVGSDGALYISDDKGGRVYRVVYTGK